MTGGININAAGSQAMDGVSRAIEPDVRLILVAYITYTTKHLVIFTIRAYSRQDTNYALNSSSPPSTTTMLFLGVFQASSICTESMFIRDMKS